MCVFNLARDPRTILPKTTIYHTMPDFYVYYITRRCKEFRQMLDDLVCKYGPLHRTIGPWRGTWGCNHGSHLHGTCTCMHMHTHVHAHTHVHTWHMHGTCMDILAYAWRMHGQNAYTCMHHACTCMHHAHASCTCMHHVTCSRM